VITVVSFARQPRLIADRIPGHQAAKLVDLVAKTPSEGGTNIEEALKLARTLAKRQHAEGAQSRVVLITDGVANLGNTIPEQLSKEVETMRQQGIAFDACGVGAEGLNDDILESLTRKGDGRYYFLNRPEDADDGFAKQLAGAFTPAAKNVKVQVVFNPKRVARYRLLGFEKHRLKKEDFRNDKVDAAEMAAEEAGNAVYQIQVNPQGDGELGEVFVRFLDASTGRMVERSWPLPYESKAKPFDLAAPSMQLAGTASMLGEKLHGTDAGSVRFSMISDTLGKLSAHYASDTKVQDLIRMCRKEK
jgi:sulfur relay (sulfurtransferase) complex TusBCD TusD component (DsrE family)